MPEVPLERRFRLLSAAFRSFAEATTDYEHLLNVIAFQLATILGDGCVLRVLNDDGWLDPVAVHMPVESRVPDGETLERLRAHMSAPHHVNEQGSARRVIESGEALIVPRVDLEGLRATTSPDIVRAYELIGIHSLLFVALRAGGKSLGLLALVRFTLESAAFSDDDRDIAQALADHAALAITNSRLLQAALREIAQKERAEALLRKTEAQLRHSQKMEAVGRLAGSIAHDFNNLLSVIISHSDLLLEDLKPVDPIRPDIESIRSAGERAATLTRQLLAFSRQQVLSPRIVDLNQAVQETEKMLHRLLGEDILLVTRLDRSLFKVKVDPGQIDQVIMNLAINARDAMPQGGKLTIETQNVSLDQTYAAEHLGVTPGPYVMLAVSDTGIGMDQETQARIFEPFFTTKDVGKGTGLGLSTVFGIVQQSGGAIWVYSEPGKGATFKLYLPKADETEIEAAEVAAPATLHGIETILLVEDQDEVRQVARQALHRYGYHVIEASNAGEALLACEQHPRAIHLLLTDVVMPMMSGREIAERLLRIRPELKVLFMSGYTENAIVHHGILDSGIAYLQKPLVPEALARRVREVLDTPAPRWPPAAKT
jgi:signal transduction histidine kinase/ActR/RegA family two-component response regulator